MTDSSVLAGVGRTVINVDVTVCPCPPHGTATSVPINQVLEETNTILHSLVYTHWSLAPLQFMHSCMLSHMASGSVPAGVGSTLVCFCLATITIVTSPSAVTHVAIDKILGKGGKRGKTEEGAREEGAREEGEGGRGRRGEDSCTMINQILVAGHMQLLLCTHSTSSSI